MSTPFFSNHRPRVVTTIGRLRMLAGILAVGYGFYMISSPTGYLNFMGESMSDYASLEELGFYSDLDGTVIALEGIAGIVIAFAMLRGKRWAWPANVALSVVLVGLGALNLALGVAGSVIVILFNGFILAYMFTKPVKAYFGRLSSPTPPVNTTTAAV